MPPACPNRPSHMRWEFWIDRGGTFTDIVARKPTGEIVTHKLLSENPQQYSDAAIHGIKTILHRAGLNLDVNESDEKQLPEQLIGAVKMGTTVATNALLERRGVRTLLVTTKGFKDALRIGYQSRPDLFALHIKLPQVLYSDVLEVDERVNAAGKVLMPLHTTQAKLGLEQFFSDGYRAVAIVLMHGYRYHEHEDELAALAAAVGFEQISTSHVVSPLMKLVSRGGTTVLDAYLSPILRRYVQQIAAALPGLKRQGGRLMFMRSSGGLAEADFFYGKDAVLSGPAGGVVGMARVSEAAGFTKIIGFDMGGTSTDVSHYHGKSSATGRAAGEFERTFEAEVAGVRLRAPMLLIHTVAAGGGSILHFDGARYRVGPDSAGAYPGPACYRNAGPLTITDCNVMLGKLQSDLFPQVFGATASRALDTDVVSQKFSALTAQIQAASDDQRSPQSVAEGFLAVAVENMANAIKKISVQRGYDVSEYTLCCFGGAGGQHACLVADALAMKRILVHPYAGVLSAYGMGLADTVVEHQQVVESVLTRALLKELDAELDTLQQQGINTLIKQGERFESGAKPHCKRLLHLRYHGSDTSLVVRQASLKKVESEFETLHRMRFGFVAAETRMVVESISVEVIAPAISSTPCNDINAPPPRNKASESEVVRQCYMDGKWQECYFYQRDSLEVDTVIDAPAVILDPTSTIVLEPGWHARLTSDNNLVLERHTHLPKPRLTSSAKVEPVMLEIFNNLFMSIAEQMGAVLENTAASVNIKERLDFSCAIFDARGALVANAPHMPVHLGSMGESINTVIRERGESIRPGDAYILNAPYNGGTHLPDVTIIKPVFTSANEPAEQLLFYVAARGHHADIGGTMPGSAPADSTTIEQEGVLIDNVKLVENGHFREREIYALLTSGRWPARNPKMNIADFKAQLAACEKGAHELLNMASHYGIDVVHAYMQHVQDNAEESVRRVLGMLNDGEFRYEMDDGSCIAVAVRVDRKRHRVVVDFSGTSAQHAGNFNAPSAVVRAAVLYVFRCLVDDNIPLNEGCLKPMQIIIPPDSMISPRHPAAVIAGNVETSQYIVDALFGALQTVAASQGTMNNFIWGNESHQYYETICGGSGATPNADGTAAVQSHMTNSRLTDPEVLEWRFPVLVESFSIRQGSGGAGRYRGGDGVVRRIKFLQAMTANILSGHRKIPPYGLAGGEPGATGRNRVEHADGRITELPGVAQIELQVGDVFVIETPGGGGYGKKEMP